MGQPAILLMGPTGAGKTDAALELVGRLPLEIVSVDSAMVYRSLDIGTAKPDAALRARIPHHLIDVCEPTERYSAGEFLRAAAAAMAQIRARGRVPPASPALRAELDARAREVGWPALHARLAQVDPVAAARIQPRDGQRIQRALEVHALTGVPLSTLQRQDLRGAVGAEYLKVVLGPQDRALLEPALELRLDAMLAAGFLGEVEGLFRRGDLDPELPALRSVGYRQLWEHVAGRCDLATARSEALRATRQLAKRQYTWLRAEPGTQWPAGDRAAQVRALDALIGPWLEAAGRLS